MCIFYSAHLNLGQGALDWMDLPPGTAIRSQCGVFSSSRSLACLIVC